MQTRHFPTLSSAVGRGRRDTHSHTRYVRREKERGVEDICGRPNSKAHHGSYEAMEEESLLSMDSLLDWAFLDLANKALFKQGRYLRKLFELVHPVSRTDHPSPRIDAVVILADCDRDISACSTAKTEISMSSDRNHGHVVAFSNPQPLKIQPHPICSMNPKRD